MKKYLIFGVILVSIFILSGNNTHAASSITVVSPNGGEELTSGATQTIRWVSSGVQNILPYICYASPTYGWHCSQLGGFSYNMGVSASFGSYSWYVDPNAPYVPGSGLKIRVTDLADPSVLDESDTSFSIKEMVVSGSTTSSSSLETPYISSLSPNSGSAGSWFSINGKNFSDSKNDILWDGSIIESASSSIYGQVLSDIRVPSSAAVGWHSINVRISSGVATNSMQFKVTSAAIPPPLKIVSPNDGAGTWNVGSSAKITWESNMSSGTQVGIFLIKNGIDMIQIGSASAQAGSFTLNVPPVFYNGSSSMDLTTGSRIGNVYKPIYKIRLKALDNSGLYSDSMSEFHIQFKSPTLSISPASSVQGNSYTFTGKLIDAMPGAKIGLYIQRPDGTLKYSSHDVGTADSSGALIINTTQQITAGQTGVYKIWIKDLSIGKDSNITSFFVSRAMAPTATGNTNLGISDLPGDIDTQKQQATCLELKNDLRYRSRDIQTNNEVSLLQDFLQSRRYLNSEPTGFFGLLTFSAVQSFQKSNGISPTGFVGPLTKGKIKNISCSLSPSISDQTNIDAAKKKARDARRISDIKQLQLASEMYYDAHNNNYPVTLDSLSPTYIPKLPKDPNSGENYKYAALGSGTNCRAYHIGATLEDSISPALNSDADAVAGTTCVGGGTDFSGTDPIYDLKP